MEEGGGKIRRRKLILALLAFVSIASPSHSASVAELSAQVGRAAQGGLDEEQEQALIGQLGDLSVQVAERYDQWVRTGSAEPRASATSLANALLPLLERLHAYHQKRTDKAVNEIIAQDGNPEVLYEQRPWLIDRGFALATAGQLSWLYYRLAMLSSEKKDLRTARLEKAVEHFSEFVYGAEPGLRDESLLGRALAERELGELDAATGDLRAVLEAGTASPLYWPARLTLAEVKAASGTGEGLSETQKLLAEASAARLPAETLNQIRLLRLQALARASKSGKSDALQREAAALARDLTRLGPGWSRRVNEVVLANVDDPRAILGSTTSTEWMAAESLAAEEKFAAAIPAYEAVLTSAALDAEQATLVQHRLGLCYFRVQRYADSERALRAFLNRAPSSPLAAEAAYLRFRAAEGVLRGNPSPETQELFASVVEAYVRGYPKHESFYEGAFRLGELQQGRGQFLQAADSYALVKGPAAFEIRAAAGEVECLADVLLNAEQGASAEWAATLRARAVAAFDRFDRLARSETGALDDLRGRTTLAKALAETAGPAPRFTDSLATLDQFESRYPSLQELWPMATALRLLAQTMLGQLEQAEKSAVALLASDDPRALELSDRIAQVLLANAVDAAGHDPAASDRWMALAAGAFDRMKAAGRPFPPEVRASLAQFYAETGRLDDAAALYAELLRDSPQSKSALRSAAMLAARRGAHGEAADYWARLAKLQEVASAGWYAARLQLAESLIAAGQGQQSCASLQEADGFRPDLRDAPTKEQFATLIARACDETDL